jgi:hypothetical protein
MHRFHLKSSNGESFASLRLCVIPFSLVEVACTARVDETTSRKGAKAQRRKYEANGRCGICSAKQSSPLIVSELRVDV